MKRSLILLLLLTPVLRAQDATPVTPATAVPLTPKVDPTIPAVPAPTPDAPVGPSVPTAPGLSDEVKKLLQDAQKMRVENRYTEALLKLDEAEKLAPQESLIFTMRGDVYLAPRRRDFDLAREQFLKALAIDPTNPGPHFNLSELEFARFNFAGAAASFRKLLTDFPKLPFEVRHLALNRVIICEARQGHFDDAEKLLKESFTFMDDTPAYQYSNAAISFAKNDEKIAQEWLLRASSIFKPRQIGPYVDALKEMRWIKDVDLDAVPIPAPVK
jgi:tetratricopeptide (TPR) repeat protein